MSITSFNVMMVVPLQNYTITEEKSETVRYDQYTGKKKTFVSIYERILYKNKQIDILDLEKVIKEEFDLDLIHKDELYSYKDNLFIGRKIVSFDDVAETKIDLKELKKIEEEITQKTNNVPFLYTFMEYL